MFSGERDVFSWLDRIRARPAMYLRNSSLQDLETLIWGYYFGLDVHGIVEAVPHMNRHFGSWLCYCHGIGGPALGWATALERRHPHVEKALAVFFKFVDEYRRLRLTTICTVRLGRKQQPTGKRVRYGLDGFMEKPRRVEVVRYRPEPLHFLRFHYCDRVEDDDILTTRTGDYATTVRFAKE